MSALVVFAGQSNMITFGLTPDQLPAYAMAPDPHVQVLVNGAFQTMVPGVNTGGPNTPNAWGPIVAYAHDWEAANPGQTLYVVLSDKGSTSLVEGVAPNWSPEQPPSADGSPNGMFNKTTVLVNEAKALTGLQVSDVFWMQGEQDATDAAAASAYGAHLTDLFVNMRSQWGADQIVFGEINASLPYGAEVRAAQEAVAAADAHTLLVSLEGLPLQADGLHLAAAGALDLGDEFYAGAALQQLLATYGLHFNHVPTLMEGLF